MSNKDTSSSELQDKIDEIRIPVKVEYTEDNPSGVVKSWVNLDKKSKGYILSLIQEEKAKELERLPMLGQSSISGIVIGYVKEQSILDRIKELRKGE